ncbi:3514_t:CDS:1, partial [Scutellospora calospora]
RKTAAQIPQDTKILEDVIIDITGHKNSQGVCIYKSINKSQKISMIKTLVNTLELASSINQESHTNTVLTEITEFHINMNTITKQNVNIVQDQVYKEFQD